MIKQHSQNCEDLKSIFDWKIPTDKIFVSVFAQLSILSQVLGRILI